MDAYRAILIQDATDLTGTRTDGYVPAWSAAAGGLVWSAGTPGPTGSIGPQGLSPAHDKMLADWGVIDETYDFMLIASQVAPTSGRVYQGTVGASASTVISKILVCTAVAGAGTPPSLLKLGLADKNGVVRALTANVASDSQWTVANAIASFSLATPYTAPGGLYMPLLLKQGTWGTTETTLGFRAYTGAVSSIGSGPLRYANSSTNGNFDLPSVGNSLPTMVSAGTQFWMATA